MAKKTVQARLKTEKTSKAKASKDDSQEKANQANSVSKKVKQTAKNISAKTDKPEKTAKEKRLPHATRPTQSEEVEILKRQNLVMDLKTNGASFRRIQKHLESLGHDVSLGTVHADYVASLERLQATNVSKTEFLATQELEKIEDSEFDLNALKTRTTDLTILEKVAIENTKISLRNQRIKLLGLDKPVVVKIQTAAEFAKRLGISPDQLPDEEDGDDTEDQ